MTSEGRNIIEKPKNIILSSTKLYNLSAEKILNTINPVRTSTKKIDFFFYQKSLQTLPEMPGMIFGCWILKKKDFFAAQGTLVKYFFTYKVLGINTG